MTQVVNLILDKLVTDLKATCQTPFPTTEPTRAKEVKKGLLQERKLENIVAIGVTGGNHEDPNYLDGIVTLDTMKNIGFTVPPREVFGGTYWYRRGVVKVECFWILKLFNEDVAHEKAYEVLGRIEQTIADLNPTGIVDQYGEGLVKVFVTSNTFFQSGGPPNNYVFRGNIFWSALTYRQDQ